VFFGAIFFVLINLCNAILVASGDSKTFGIILVCGFFLNLILDPWFLYGGFGLPAMGIAGIAWATVVIQGIGSLIMLRAVVSRGLVEINSLADLIPDFRIYLEVARQAVPASFNIMQVALSFFVITFFLKTYGEANVAAFGVTTRIEQIGLLPTMGLSAAIMALVGQNNGAAKYDRIRSTMKIAIVAGQALNLTTSIVMFVFARQLMSIFTTDEEVIQLGVNCLYVIAPIQWSYVLTSAHLNMLQAMKRPMYGFFEAMLRKVLLPAPLFFLFVSYWAMPVDWVWYSVAVTNVLMTVVTVVVGQKALWALPVQQKNEQAVV
jgi:putative MATE family efflux protein